MTGTWNQTGLGRHWRQDLFHAVVHALNKDQSKHGVNIRGVNILREMYLAMVSKYTNPQKDEENKKQHAASATFDSNKKQFPLCVVVFLCFILRDGGQVKKNVFLPVFQPARSRHYFRHWRGGCGAPGSDRCRAWRQQPGRCTRRFRPERKENRGRGGKENRSKPREFEQQLFLILHCIEAQYGVALHPSTG